MYAISGGLWAPIRLFEFRVDYSRYLILHTVEFLYPAKLSYARVLPQVNNPLTSYADGHPPYPQSLDFSRAKRSRWLNSKAMLSLPNQIIAWTICQVAQINTSPGGGLDTARLSLRRQVLGGTPLS